MGNSSGKHSTACKEALSGLDSNEVETLEKQFRAAAGRKAPQDKLDADALGQALGLSSSRLSTSLFKALQSISGAKSKDAEMAFDDFAVAVTKATVSARYERRSFWNLVVAGHEGGSAPREMMRAVIEEEVSRGLPSGASSSLRETIVTETVAAAFEGKGGDSLTSDELEQWLMANESSEAFFADIMQGYFLRSTGGSARPKVQMPTLSRPSALLKEAHLFALARQMPRHCLEAPWKLLYNSNKHGQSFARFTSKILFKGPTVIVIRDKGGASFGMFAGVSWRRHNQFYGDASSLVFSLTPKCKVYRSSGVNKNYQFLATNLTSASCANGLGMGGQMDFWGLHLGDHLEDGVCRAPCSTFSNMPCLSSDAKFQIDVVEVWGCVPTYVADEKELEAAGVKRKKAKTWEEYQSQRDGKTILEGNLEGKAVLEAAGRTNYSADVRAADALMAKEKAHMQGSQGGGGSDSEDYDYE
mmetsp:Transcript_6547/g.12713  ORF Transcript_6547/g.12713 Transcript_6547/m.12713 type:complete len:472 (+) Transcript_6547:206-1621(+)|eukprot:CAMPEP_0173379582 /NCGR_PEP_ID=MMETSP1356-20130122/2467_1 /TAXON_ID=77927 ORGANISM="Hemiselmis virescens, Strain PCC157" /NCGR_SAMPLE_ID=MMETSP1356 /ASSEMBLY_ACC=CAM_ASM_000847 /LENGTH=471 /DNA_ID=CAMNT_0014332941 /DNA_START=191 /DNA_END=1606 /DNA_ORIENTATION=+